LKKKYTFADYKKIRENMILIQEILVSDDVVSEQFVCNLSACKGACCWEGDLGAPLDDEEVQMLKDIYPTVRPFLSPEGQKRIDDTGGSRYFKDMKQHGTQLMEGRGACAWLTFEQGGIAKCGIEKAWEAGAIAFQKPISCHLYPIRIAKNAEIGFEAINYDRWDICSDACSNGKSLKVPVYQFLKNAITRKYGAAFYEELDAVAEHLRASEG
jgi:hypothetical protein